MKIPAFVVTPDNYGPALSVLGTTVTVLASNAATKAGEVTLQQGDEGTGPPPHSHPWDESFFVLKGAVEFFYDGTTTLCQPGTLIHLPAGTVHGFRYGAGGGEILEFTGQGSGAAQMFTAMNDRIQPGPVDVPQVLRVLEENRVTVAA